MKKIAIIYTTFLREELMERTIKSIINNWHEDFVLLIGDQSSPPPWAPLPSYEWLRLEIPFLIPHEYYGLPFDCGLSAARNILVHRAADLGIEYCLVTADSIEFVPETISKIDNAIQFLDSKPTAGILGFELQNRAPWEFLMDKDDCFVLTKSYDFAIDRGTNLLVKKCDICRNFFIAKTKTLQTVLWDVNLKLFEHEDFFWRYKQAGYGVWWTPDIVGNYIHSTPPRYLEYRKRMYREFRDLLLKKHNLKKWVTYRD